MTLPTILTQHGCFYEPPGTILAVIETGSTLHGTVVEDSSEDLDLTVVVAADPEYVTGLSRWESHVWRTAADGERSYSGDVDVTFYELRKFIGLACHGNPSILAPLYAPPEMVHHHYWAGRYDSVTAWQYLADHAPSIVSKLALPRFQGYMRSQCLRLIGERGASRGARTGARPELVKKYGFDTKFAMHMVRLGLQGLELARNGRLELPMKGAAGGACRTIRRGVWEVDDCVRYAAALYEELQRHIDSSDNTVLRNQPDYATVNAALHNIYRAVWE